MSAFGGRIGFSGNLNAKKISPKKIPVWLWKLTNLPHVWRGWWRFVVADALRLAYFKGELRAKVLRSDGSVEDLGLLSLRVVTTAWVTAMATLMFDGSGPAATAYDYHDSGVGTTAENVSNTDIETTDGEARVSGTASNPAAGQYRNVGTIAYTTTKAITEHGLFSALTGGTLLDRSVFSAINVVNGDSIQFTYTLTFSAGG